MKNSFFLLREIKIPNQKFPPKKKQYIVKTKKKYFRFLVILKKKQILKKYLFFQTKIGKKCYKKKKSVASYTSS